jgi:hypothetical protein
MKFFEEKNNCKVIKKRQMQKYCLERKRKHVLFGVPMFGEHLAFICQLAVQFLNLVFR